MSDVELKRAELNDPFVHFTMDGMPAGVRRELIAGYRTSEDGGTLVFLRNGMHLEVDDDAGTVARRIADHGPGADVR